MAEHLDSKDESTTNPCCSQWKDRYLKLHQKCKKVEEGRAYLKTAVDIYKEQFDNLRTEYLKFQKAYEELKLQTNHERMDKEKESSARISLENEISTLKSEINCLREQLQKKSADVACENSKAEKTRAQQEFSNLKSQLSNAEKENKQLKKDLQKEKTRADLERKRADEMLKAAKTEQSEIETNNLETEISRLKDLLDKEKKRVGFETKKADEFKKLVDNERKKAKKFANQLQKKYEHLKKDVDQKKSQLKNGSDLEFVKESAEMKLLKKRLKLEKSRVKHANKVAEHEKKCNKAVEQELNQLKLEIALFSNRVGLCNCLAVYNLGKSCIEKNGIANEKMKFLHPESGKEVVKITEYLKPSLNSPTVSLPISGTCTESIAGIPSKMGNKLDNFVLVSSMSSFSDRQLVGPQEKCNKKRKRVNTIESTEDLEILENIFDGDYMKLLNLDNEIDEGVYRAAVKNPVSPTLPNIEFETNQYIVVFPEFWEFDNLSKMFQTITTFTSQCCEFSQTDFVLKNVTVASTDDNFSPKEKVCVFFSLFLKSFSSVALTNFDHVYDAKFLSNIYIFSRQFKKAISDIETRAMFTKLVDIDELISLIQKFIINKQVLICNEKLSFPDTKASFHQLILGAILLATVCAAFDHIDSICDTSYAISGITDSSTLTILHVFGHICGEKLLNHGEYSLIMTVVKSLVIYCEKDNTSSDFSPCAKCPFSIGAVSMEEIASLLLKRFSDCCVCMHEYGITSYKSIKFPDDNLSNLGDVLSLMELLASKMNWGWVCENIISQVLKLLEVCVLEASLAAVFVLLGQIARLGIDANGFEDTEIENIRVKLSSFISQTTANKISLPVQFAAINALLTTTPLDFQEICKNRADEAAFVSPLTATDSIQKWFSLLTDEQKALSVRLLTVNVS